MKTREKYILNDCVFNRLVFRADNMSRLIVNPDEEERHDCHTVYGDNVNLDSGWDNYFLFYVQDMFDPIKYIVSEKSFEDAYEAFIESQVEYLKIEEPDLKDYDENDIQYSCNGVPVDTESIQGQQVYLIEASNY
jgi:hypothetical protein